MPVHLEYPVKGPALALALGVFGFGSVAGVRALPPEARQCTEPVLVKKATTVFRNTAKESPERLLLRVEVHKAAKAAARVLVDDAEEAVGTVEAGATEMFLLNVSSTVVVDPGSNMDHVRFSICGI